MEKQIAFENSNGSKLAGIINETNNHDSILIMAHGFSSNKNTAKNVRLSEMLNKVGFASLRFDFFGHGDSDGDFEDITITEAVDDVLQAIRFVRKLGYKKIGLVGSSFGGISSILATSKTDSLSFLVLRSPVSDYWELEKSRYSDQQLNEWKEVGYRDYEDGGKHMKLKYTFIDDFKNNDAYLAAKKIKVPTLIVHGNADKDVPLSQSEKLVKLLPNGKLITIKGADHQYTNEAHTVKMLKIICGFVTDHFEA